MSQAQETFHVGSWAVRPDLAEISCGDHSLTLRAQVLDLLVYLAEKPGEVVSTEALMNDLWTGKIVTEGAIYNTVAELRSALASCDDGMTYLQTIPKKGYRLVAPITDSTQESMSGSGGADENSLLVPRKSIAALGLLVAVLLALVIAVDPADLDLGPAVAPEQGPPTRKFTIELPRPMPDFGRAYSPVLISGDGKALIFGGDVDEGTPIRRRRFDGFSVGEIRGTSEATGVFAIAPNSGRIAFVDHSDGLIKSVSVDGGVPVPLVDPGSKVWGIAWARDDSIVYEAGSYPGLMRWTPAETSPGPLTRPEDGKTHKHPSFSPDGRALLFTIGERGSTPRDSDKVAALSLETGEMKILVAGSSPSIAPDGSLMYFRDRSVWTASFDQASLSVTGDAVAVAQDVHYENQAHYAVSDDGTLVYVSDYNTAPRHLVWVDHEGTETRITEEPAPYFTPRLSPDGEQVAVVIDSKRGADLWVYSLERRTFSRLTHDSSREASPVWSNDGTFIVYSSNRVDDLFRVDAAFPYEIQQLTSSPNYQFAYSLTPDDRYVLYTEAVSNTQRLGDIHSFALDDEARPETVLSSQFSEYQPSLSPDGLWLAYISDRSGNPEAYVRRYGDPDGEEVRVSLNGAKAPRWARDGGAIVYRGVSDLEMTYIDTTGGLVVGETKRILNLDDFEFYDLGNFDISSDGERFLMVKTVADSEFPASRVVVVQNWLQNLQR